jgi:hypothetical protein
MAETATPEPAKIEQKAAKKPKNDKFWKRIAILVGFAIVGIFVIIMLFAQSVTGAAKKVSDQLVSDIQNNNAVAAYSLFSPEAKQTVSEADFKTIVDAISPILTGEPNLVNKEVSAKSGEDTTGKVVYTIKGTDGITYNFEVNLVKQDDIWLVQNFDSSKQ